MAKTVNINSLLGYMRYLEKECEAEDILFRGQQREDWTLLPKLARIKTKKGVLYSERDMLTEFKRQSIPHLTITPTNDWEWLALAQHHGMATRLLDWTKNPLAALWFAVREPPNNGVDGVVWAFEVLERFHISDIKESPLDQNGTRVYRPNNITASLVAQQGWFTVHAFTKSRKGFVPLEKNKRYKSKLIKLRISNDFFYDIRFHLDRCGVNEASMFPNIGGLSRHIQWSHSFLEDEQED
jgi:hypothetical protein